MGNRLAQVRADQGWKKARLLRELRAAAWRRKETLPKDESLARRVAAWENQNAVVGEFYRELLCDVYQMSALDLGIAELPRATESESEVAPAADETGERLSFSRLDTELLTLLRGQTQSIRLLDRRLGGEAIYQQTTAHVRQIEALLKYAVPSFHREAAADELSQAAALAGWQALDLGRLDDAWRLHETAVAAAREAGVPASLAYARAQQAYVLMDAGRLEDAYALIRATRERVGTVSPALRSWLHAAEGEALAALGQRDDAYHALDAAVETLSDTTEESSPFLMLDQSHLLRWRGHCLARLGEGEAVDNLTTALAAMTEGRYGRAEASLRVDLALALRTRGELEESKIQALRAADAAGRAGSQRQHRRIVGLAET